jgi:hypothetical protein
MTPWEALSPPKPVIKGSGKTKAAASTRDITAPSIIPNSIKTSVRIKIRPNYYSWLSGSTIAM